MFGVGFGEIILVLAIALLVYGPERLPGIARKLAILVKQWKKISTEVQESIEREIHDNDEANHISSSIHKIASDVKETLNLKDKND